MMNNPSTPTISEHIKRLSEKISAELERLHQTSSHQGQSSKNKQTDTLLYIGHWQDAIPRAIWVDPLLDAIDVRAWGVLRTQAIADSAVMLSLNRLIQQQLHYSKATLSKILYVLRLTRWISWCSEIRQANGRFQGHIYAIHDAPLPFNDALYLDHHYLTFVRQQQAHKNKQIKHIAQNIWQHLNDQIDQQADFLSTTTSSDAMADFMAQMNDSDWNKHFNPDTSVDLSNSTDQVHLMNPGQNHQVQYLNLAEKHRVQNMNLVQKHRVHILNPVKKKTRIKENQALNNQVQKMNPAGILTTTTTSCSSSSLRTNRAKKATTTKSSEFEYTYARAKALIFPTAFNASEIELAHLYLKRIDPELQQDFLDETAAQIAAKRNSSKPIRNPVAYLSWLCNEHVQGNTLLTSLGIRYRENRQRQEKTEKYVRTKQQELTQMAKDQRNTHPKHELPDNKPDRSTTKTNKWGQLHFRIKHK